MSTNQLNQQNNQENEVFKPEISSYIPIDDNTSISPPIIEEEVVTEEFLTRSGIDSEQLDLNMALCREFEGE